MNSGNTIKLTASVTLIGLIGLIWSGSAAFSNKADKSELESVRRDLTELSAKQREDFIIQKNILSLLEKMDARMVKIEDNQRWQIHQEEQRLKWESPFKTDSTPSPPSPNVKR